MIRKWKVVARWTNRSPSCQAANQRLTHKHKSIKKKIKMQKKKVDSSRLMISKKISQFLFNKLKQFSHFICLQPPISKKTKISKSKISFTTNTNKKGLVVIITLLAQFKLLIFSIKRLPKQLKKIQVQKREFLHLLGILKTI